QMKSKPYNIFFSTFSLILSICANSSPNFYNIRDFGAKGDGTTLDTKAINDAIGAASLAGGGTVYFPAGKYLSYSIHLKDHIVLYLEAGSILIAADSSANGKYDDAEPNAHDQFQ